MKIPVHIAGKLLQLAEGETIPDSSAKHSLIDELVNEGIIERRGRIKKTLQLCNLKALNTFLQNRFSVNDLTLYVQALQVEDISRSELVSITSDSKLRKTRSFQGFLANCYSEIQVIFNGRQTVINPVEGTFQFIYDFGKFIPAPDVTIVGIENPENFRYIERQQYLFTDLMPLFISRYPQTQSKDVIKWLHAIPNKYVHFGDFDFAGIGIYLNEYKKFLSDKASFFLPPNIEELIAEFGNKDRYDQQKINFNVKSIREIELLKLIEIIHKYRKGLDQELLIRM